MVQIWFQQCITPVSIATHAHIVQSAVKARKTFLVIISGNIPLNCDEQIDRTAAVELTGQQTLVHGAVALWIDSVSALHFCADEWCEPIQRAWSCDL